MVKSTKRCLKKLLANEKLNYEDLFTVMTEAEAVLNSRLLTYMYSEDIKTPLTPSHLVMGKRLLTLPDTTVKESNEVDLRSDLTRRAKYVQTLSIHFWNRFRREYLLSLLENYKGVLKCSRGSETIHEGDIVVVHDDNLPRTLWHIGRVQNLLKGNDGYARGAVVRVGDKGKRSLLLPRSVQKLYPLEVQDTKTVNRDVKPEGKTDVKAEEIDCKPPKRRAAVEANEKRKLIDKFS